MKIKDKVEYWRITIEGVGEDYRTLIGNRKVMTNIEIECDKSEIPKRQFEQAWNEIMEKAEDVLE